MTPRYLLVVGDKSPDRAAFVAQLSRRTGLELTLSSQRLAVLAHPSCGFLEIGDSGCILGSLFHRHGRAQRISLLSESDVVSVTRSNGQALLKEFWGGYVAAIIGRDSVRILRDPSGDFPCYYSRCANFTVFAADAELLVNGGVAKVSIDFDSIGRQLYRAFVPAPSTALNNIHELLAGFALCLPSDAEPVPCWSPWDHVRLQPDAPPAASERLARIIQHSIQAWASTQRRILLSVSGGLDSSIVATCLAKGGADTVCLTMFSDDSSGDERPFARALCDQLGLPLIERPHRIEDIDITEPMAVNLPRPRDRIHALTYKHAQVEVATKIGAGAYMTGNGGDNVLGYSQTAAPIADRYLTDGLCQATISSLFDVCRQTGCSIFDAVRKALKLAHGPAAYHVRPEPLFLNSKFIATCHVAELRHPWLEAPDGALPGKAAHIATILRAQPTLEPGGGTQFPVINPLISQPIVEACLAIPSWEWRTEGRDRALARRAFANDLPAIILNRRVKGSPGRFASRVLDHFRPAICDRLLAGRLALNGIIDSVAIEKILVGERPVPDIERVRILELVNAEAWIDHWMSRK